MKARHSHMILAALAAAVSITRAEAAVTTIDPVIVLPELFDAKNYPGAICQAVDGDQEADLNHYSHSSDFLQLPPLPSIKKGGTWNEATAPRRVVCPIVRDNISNTSGTYGSAPGATLGVNVWVNNQGLANTLTCTLFSNDPWGNQVAASSASAAVGLQQLNLDVNVSTALTGHYALECALPPNSSIFSFRVYEAVRTDFNN